MTEAERGFIDQYTRSLMVQWAHTTVEQGSVVLAASVYKEHALNKGWLTKKEPLRVTAKGFGVAAAFLKR